MSEFISQREYARRRGCSHEAVRKAIKAGRIAAHDGKIDPDEANRQWAGNTDETKSKNTLSGNPHLRAIPGAPEQPAEGPGPSSGESNAGPSYTQARAVREAYTARLARLEYEERNGKLIEVERVRIDWFNFSRAARDMLLAIPARLAPVLAAETDPFTIHMRLDEELRRVSNQLADYDGIHGLTR